MPLSPQEEFELLSLERERAFSQTPSTPAVPKEPTIQDQPITKGRMLQSLPKSLAYGPEFTRAIPGNEGLDTGAVAAGGEITDLTGSPLLGTGVRMLPDIASMAIGSPIGKLAAPAMEGTAKWLMQSAMKPTAIDLLSGKAQRGAETLLERGISPTNAGMMKLKSLGEELNKAVEELISKSSGTVNKSEAAAGIKDVVTKIEGTNPVPNQAIHAAEDYYNQFMANKLIPPNMPVEQAQAMKQGLYKILKDQYGKLNLAGQAEGQAARTLSQKALASGLREKIESVIPGVKPLNKEASDIWNALNVSERKALMEANKDPVGMAVFPHNPIAMLSFWANRSAAFKSGLAKILYKESEALPAGTAQTGTGVVEAGTQP